LGKNDANVGEDQRHGAVAIAFVANWMQNMKESGYDFN